MSHGLVLGKFYPPHAGHHLLIDAALERCERVTVLVLGSSIEERSMPMELRRRWLAARHPAARVLAGLDDHPIDFEDPAVYDLHDEVIRSLCPERVDVVVSSEPYGEVMADRWGCEHLMVDRDRRRAPVSATAVRADPAAYWWALEPPVRAWFARRVVVVGAESTGTTTVARALAGHYGTGWVPEFGRAYSVPKFARGDHEWRDDEFVLIARRQVADEDAEAGRVPVPLLICDTDALATCVWQERYVGRSTAAVEAIAASRHYDLYLLTSDAGVPFVQDGLRDGEHLRGWMTARFRERLAERPEPWVVLEGTHEQRMQRAVQAIDDLMAKGWDLEVPLGSERIP